MDRILAEPLEKSRLMVEEALGRLPEELGEECFYSLGAGGKRVRPFLVFESCKALGGDPSLALNAACAVEMIHTYSLIHDDLPGMDDDSMRRGKPSLHVVFGERRALLAGDRLLAGAFEHLLRSPLCDDVLLEMTRRLADAAGPGFLTGGQFMDMYHPREADAAWTRRMILGKTSAMIRVSMELGSLAAGVDDRQLASISSIGDDTGWLFQLTDDILDVTGSSAEMGKAVMKDADMGKWNPVQDLGLDGAKALASSTARDITRRLGALAGDWGVVSELVNYLPERRK
ncbi:MAG TPA: polyprenyl synthetase family protein [Candidatus Sabulitectum sp.]|nr:polyprenyl synthetase family protein [Candidatus Sabulitectum sp.]